MAAVVASAMLAGLLADVVAWVMLAGVKDEGVGWLGSACKLA